MVIRYLLERTVCLAGGRVCENHTALQVRTSVTVRVTNLVDWAIIHKEEDFASCRVQIRPAVLKDGRLKTRALAADIVWNNELFRVKNGANLAVDKVKQLRAVPLDNLGAADKSANFLGRLELEQDGDRHRLIVVVHPAFDDAEALHQAGADSADVEIGDVQDLGAVGLVGWV